MKYVKIGFILVYAMSISLFASGGHWEFGSHYSYWTVNFAGQLIEDNIITQIDDYDASKGDFNFKSNGNNYGLEIRYFPGGKDGSFSLGVSIERNNFKAKMKGGYNETYNGYPGTVTGDGTMDLRPHSINLSLRWELWPSARIHPYFGLGFGFGKMDGEFKLDVVKTVYYPGNTSVITETDTLTLEEAMDDLKNEGDEFPFNFFPIIHVNFGLRVEVLSNLYILGEAAFYDGIVFRGGIAVRL